VKRLLLTHLPQQLDLVTLKDQAQAVAGGIPIDVAGDDLTINV
jgi:ribonuclease BN (tRNA processing enzyme)